MEAIYEKMNDINVKIEPSFDIDEQSSCDGQFEKVDIKTEFVDCDSEVNFDESTINILPNDKIKYDDLKFEIKASNKNKINQPVSNDMNLINTESETMKHMLNDISFHFLDTSSPSQEKSQPKISKEIHPAENDITEIKKHVCEVCNKRFKYRSQMTAHQLIHTDIKTFTCASCDKQFRHKSDLVKHSRVHTNEKPFQCDVCFKSFKHNSHLIGHKRLHTGEKPYSCDFCLKQFTDRSTLARHTRVHTGVKPYECDICQKSFTRKPYLTSHKLTQHSS